MRLHFPRFEAASRRQFPAAFLLLWLFCRFAAIICFGDVQINEVVADSDDRLLFQNQDGSRAPGSSVTWNDPVFNDSAWWVLNAPLGLGFSGVTAVLNNALTESATSFYIRRNIDLEGGVPEGDWQLVIDVDYDDAFVLYINGKEAGRKNMGAPGLPVLYDMPAFNDFEGLKTATLILENPEEWLIDGNNCIALQVLRLEPADGTIYIDCGIVLDGGQESIVLCNKGETWRVFPGIVEPGGGIYDDSFLEALPETVKFLWTLDEFDDSAWPMAQGPFGYDAGTDYPVPVNLVTQMRDQTLSLYLRKKFSLTNEQLEGAVSLRFHYDFDDGFAAYLNGRDLWRRNLGALGEFIAFDRATDEGHSASNDNGTYDASEFLVISLSDLDLQPGDNVFAVQLHNTGLTSSDLFFAAELSLVYNDGSESPVLSTDEAFSYFIGYWEPAPVRNEQTLPATMPEWCDWIELFNDGDSAVDLSGWSLSDDPDLPGKWIFPDLILNKGQYLVLLASGGISDAVPSSWYHLPFKLDGGGEYLGLYDASGNPVDSISPEYPDQHPHYSWGKSEDTGEWSYLRPATPGAANVAGSVVGQAVKPSFYPAPGIVEELSTITLEAATDSSEIYVTFDGSIPSPDNGILYTRPLDYSEITASQLDYEVWFLDAGTYSFDLAGFDYSVPPDYRSRLHEAKAPMDRRDWFTGRISGFIEPPESGEYEFWVAADAQAQLYLSSGESRTDLSLAVSLTQAVEADQWDVLTGQHVSGISLSGGQRYYFELRYWENAWRDHASVAWRGPGFDRKILQGSSAAQTHGFTSFCLRARAFATDMLPSEIATGTFLLDTPDALKTIPVMCLAGSPDYAWFSPYGIVAQKGGEFYDRNYGEGWTDIVWRPLDVDDYSMHVNRGRGFEREVSFEFFPNDERENVQLSAGIRAAGSVYFRPRLHPLGIEHGLWTGNRRKPSFNLFFRDAYSGKLDYPFFKDSAITDFYSLRLRGGHNDSINPFIIDEFTRRLFLNMGYVNSVGNFVTMVVNGEVRGYYNPVDRMREEFFQEWYDSEENWDVQHIWDFVDGDGVQHRYDTQFLKEHDLSILENYEEAARLWDPVNVADYIILNVYISNWDWPHNNWVMARERSDSGVWRFHVWDAEISWGLFGLSAVDTDNFTTLLVENVRQIDADIPLVFSSFYKSEEFRLLFADRAQKHLYDKGILTGSTMTTIFEQLRDEVNPVIEYLTGNPMLENWFRDWVPARRNPMFTHMREHGLWPGFSAPSYSVDPGVVEPDTIVELSTYNGTDDIYFTVDGSDPRAVGGAPRGTLYTVPVVINQTMQIKSRVLHAGIWSAMRDFVYTVLPTARLMITELHYHPEDDALGEDLDIEFIELFNAGDADAQLNGIHFTDGIDFSFSQGDLLAPGEYLILTANTSVFQQHYPGVSVGGEFSGRLDNSGERISLSDLSGTVIHSVEYGDSGDWPERADGLGFTLVRTNADISADPDDPLQWRTSINVAGSPGMADPLPIVTPVWINEILTHTDLPQVDSIELYNPNPESVDVSGWWLSDDPDDPRKIRLPQNSLIPSTGYLVIDESVFGPESDPQNGFRISSHGEILSLYSADPDGALTGFYHVAEVDASANGVSFGRYINSIGKEDFVPLKELSLGQANGKIRNGPVIISEIMYRPVGEGMEFIEIWNIGDERILLYDERHPQNTWRISGSGFYFPIGASLNPGQQALIVPVDPLEYRINHNVPEGTDVYGPFPGSLSNAGEKISLQWPDTPDVALDGSIFIPYVTMDMVDYGDGLPWPVLADGVGPSLEKINPWIYGNDPANWRASSDSGGSPGHLPAGNYADWNLLYFQPGEIYDGIVTAADFDLDGDKVVNLLEYLFRYNPRSRENIFPVTLERETLGNDQYLTLSMRVRKNLSGVTLNVQASLDLNGEQWYSGINYIQEDAPIDHQDGTVTRHFRCLEPLQENDRQFMRLAVSVD